MHFNISLDCVCITIIVFHLYILVALLLRIIFFNIRVKHFTSFFIDIFHIYELCFRKRCNMIFKYRIIINQAKHTGCFSGNIMKILKNSYCVIRGFFIITMNGLIAILSDIMKCIHNIPTVDKFPESRVGKYICESQLFHFLIMSGQINEFGKQFRAFSRCENALYWHNHGKFFCIIAIFIYFSEASKTFQKIKIHVYSPSKCRSSVMQSTVHTQYFLCLLISTLRINLPQKRLFCNIHSYFATKIAHDFCPVSKPNRISPPMRRRGAVGSPADSRGGRGKPTIPAASRATAS